MKTKWPLFVFSILCLLIAILMFPAFKKNYQQNYSWYVHLEIAPGRNNDQSGRAAMKALAEALETYPSAKPYSIYWAISYNPRQLGYKASLSYDVKTQTMDYNDWCTSGCAIIYPLQGLTRSKIQQADKQGKGYFELR